MPNVTLECKCPQSVVTLTIQAAKNKSDVDAVVFKESGKKTVTLAKGVHFVNYVGKGTPGTTFSVSCAKGGEMDAIERTLPDTGVATGNRDLKVT